MNIFIGDVQGCCGALETLLQRLDFSPSRDRLYLLGDLVNRGPASLPTLRLLMKLGDAATCLLGNHDLHLLALAHGVRPAHKHDSLAPILQAEDHPALLDWLRHRHVAHAAHGWLMVHAGVVPQWDEAQTLALAAEVQAVLRGPDLPAFLHEMYGNEPDQWSEDLSGTARLRFVINTLTRLRFCTAEGRLDFETKDSAASAPVGLMPWFDVPGRKSAGTRIAFGHWSTLGLIRRDDLLALDTGCVWGGELSAALVEDDGRVREIVQVQCEQARKPGKG
ncbi:symmetrical bis(5'-nucleosyl)-tetraphosphatase [Burkholderiaceae bacterium UC74_6]